MREKEFIVLPGRVKLEARHLASHERGILALDGETLISGDAALAKVHGSYALDGHSGRVTVEKDCFLVVLRDSVLRLAAEDLRVVENVSLPSNFTECRGNLTCISPEGKLLSLGSETILEVPPILAWSLDAG